MKILTFEIGPIATNCYLVYDENSLDAVLIDPANDAAEVCLKTAADRNLNLKAIFLTHSHWDHAAEASLVKEKSGADIYIHPDDEYRILDPMAHTVFQLPFEIPPVRADKYFSDNTRIKIGTMEFLILHTPGHTEGSVSIYLEKEKLIFTGDALFHRSIGRTDLPGGDFEQLADSIRNKILTLPVDCRVLPGHGPETTVIDEKLENPFINQRPI